MNTSSSRFEVRSMSEAFSYAIVALGDNTVTQDLERDYAARKMIETRLQDMGQYRAVNLAHKNSESTISLALYTGDGVVTKIIPERYYERFSPIHTAAPITSDCVESDDVKYYINTYPWIRPGNVSMHDIEVLRATMGSVGLRFTNGDDRADNIHRMPDGLGTLAGIDSDMFLGCETEEHKILRQHWQRYLEGLFPKLYGDFAIPIQSKDTNFAFVSAHDPDTRILGFDASRIDPVIMKPDEGQPCEDKRHGEPIWRKLFHGKNKGNTGNSGPNFGLH